MNICTLKCFKKITSNIENTIGYADKKQTLLCEYNFVVVVFFLYTQALEQDMSSRQSSISTMKAKVKKFVETAEPAAASTLQAKMEGLIQRLDDACEKHKQKISQMEKLKNKVEQFEKTFEKVQEFVLKNSHALCETDGPGNVNELSQLVQVIPKP